VEGQSFSGVIGTFFNPGSTAPASAYAATIQWGDGSASAGTVSGPGGAAGFQVAGSHVYAAAGSDSMQIQVAGPNGQSLLINQTTALVADAPLTGHAVTYGAAPGTYNDVVGSFSDANLQARPGDFRATIQWGDGSTSAGLVSGQGGRFTVTGQHTYPAGTYAVNVAVQDTAGSTTSWASTLYVGTQPAPAALPLLAADPTINAIEGQSLPGSTVVATFTDSDGNTDPTKYTATINWGDGPTNYTGTVAYNSGTGQFQVSGGHTYAEEGSAAIQVNVTDTADSSHYQVTSTALVSDSTLTVVGANSVNPTAGTPWSGQLLTFTDTDPNGTSSDYAASLDWGDGQVSAGTIGVSGGNFTVSGTHTYASAGPFTIQVTLSDSGGASTPTSLTPSIIGLQTTGANLSYVAGIASSATVATFQDTDGDGNPSHFNVAIAWGDGTTTNNPTLSGLMALQVQASHTYARQGYYTITTSISDTADGQAATVLSNANVGAAALSGSAALNPGTGLSYAGSVANFADGDNDANPADYQAQIRWGDGGTSAGSLSHSLLNFTVSGSHTYAATGNYTVTALVTDLADGSSTTVSGTLTITPAPGLTLSAASNLISTEGTALTNLAVATLSDIDGNTSSSAYAGTTIDWGDGSSPSTATVSGSGPFTIAGTHTYAEAGAYTITVNASDTDGASATGLASITINDAALTPTNRTLTGTTGVPLNGVTVASFTDANTAGPVTDFTALVNWGDSSPVTAGAVSGSGGSFTVAAGHLYGSAATYHPVVTISDVDGQSVTATSTITVTNPSASLSVNAVSATEGASYSSSTLASFTPATGSGGDTFVASLGWGDGAVTYGTLTSNGLGGYNISGSHTYADESSSNNPESLTVTVLDQTTGAIAARGTASVTVADATLSGTANSITAWTNQTTGLIVVASFTDANSAAPASDFTASISWGDGSSAGRGTVLPTPGGSPGQFTVYGQHTWASAGSFTVQTTVTDVGSSTAQVSGTATVAASSTTLSATEGSSYSGVVASFTGNPANATGATITWGDGTANSSGNIVATGGNSFNVTTSGHTYADDGVYNLSVTVTMSGSGPLTASGPAVVADASLSGTANNLSAWVGQPLGFVAGQSDNPVTIATFTDANTGATAADFAGTTVNWGDGTTSTPTVVAGSPAGTFIVQANHSYVQPGAYTVTTTVLDQGGMATNLQGTATVGIREGQQYDAVLRLSLPDPATTAPPASYNATLTWGDGSPNSSATATPVYSYSNGQLTGALLVTATHVYAASGSFTVSATATNPNTSNSSTGSQSLTVGDALLNAIPQAVNAVAGSSTGTITVAQFEDDNPSATTSQFTTVTLNWGDGSGNQSGTVASTGTAGLFLVQGSHTYSSSGSYTITATVTDTGGQSVTVTSTATVSNAWTVLAGSGARTADPDRADLIPLGEASVDLNQGAVRISHALDFDQSPGTEVGGSPALVYNSATVSPRPVIQLQLQSDPNTGNPAATQYQVAWSFNGVNQTTATFPVSNFQAGAVYLMAVQVGSAVTATGVYPWSATVTITRQGGGTTTATASGYVPVVMRDSSPYGAGWGLDGVNQLFPISANGNVPAGLLWVTGAGDSRFFTGSGPYTSPEDFGTLAQNGSAYRYTAKDQTQWNFNSSGLQTSVVAPTGLTLTYTYTSGLLTGVSAPDGGSTTLSYDTHNFVYQIGEPGGSRTVGLTQTEVQVGSNWQSTLTQITDVDSTTRALGYDTAHHLTSDSWAPLYTSFSFDPTSGLLTGLTRGQSSPTMPYTIVASASDGLGATTTSQAWGKLTDGNNHTSQGLFDLRGRPVQDTDALSNNSYDQRNAAGDVVREVDPLGHVTINTYSTAEDLTQVTFAAGSFDLYQYDPTFHEVTQTINSLGETSRTTYNQTTGLPSSSTDALGNTTTYVWTNGQVQSETDPLGHARLYRYDSALRPVFQIDALGNWAQTGYDSNGNVASSTDALGYVTLMAANGRGLVTQTTDANGDVPQDQYYADGELHSETNARGFTRTITVDARGLTTASTDFLGNATTNSYDAAGNPTSVTDPDSNTSTFQFDADNRQTSASTPLSEQSQIQYDAAGNITATIDANGASTHYYYDLLNQSVLTVDPLGYSQYTVLGPTGETLAIINPMGAVGRTLYNADERPTETLDPLGNTAQIQYDADGNVSGTTDARGYSTHYLYTGASQPAARIDPNGNVTRNVFNALGEKVQVIDGNGHTWTYGFDLLGHLNAFTDPDSHRAVKVFSPTGAVLDIIDANGNSTLYTLDGNDRTVQVKDPRGNSSSLSLDGAGLVRTFTDANGKVTTRQYNPDEEAVAAIDPNGHTATSAYDKTGRPLASYDGNQNGSYSGYNAGGQATGSGLATGASTTEAYNALGQVTQVTDPDNNVTRMLYDQDGRQVGTIDPLGHFSFQVYNQNGQTVQRVDRDGRTINDSYDPAGRLTTEVWLGANGAQADSLGWQYDAANHVTRASNSYGSYAYTLDPANRLTQQTDPFNLTLTITQDPNGNVTQVNDSAGGNLHSVYNGDNQLTSRQFSGGPNNAQLREDITYTPAGQVSLLTRYADTNGTQQLGQTQKSYDPTGNVTEIKHTNAASTVLEDFTYQFDAANRLSSETDTINGTAATITYGYDASNQLTSAGGTNYGYDANGNRNIGSSQVGANNQLTTDGNWNYQYDPEGNVIQKVGVSGGPDGGISWVFSYDNRNNLTGAQETVNGTLTIQETMAYDALGQRVELDVTQGGTTTVTRFAYDQTGGVWADLNGTNQIQVRRISLDTLDNFVARVGSDGTEAWYLTDQLGSSRGLMNNSGSLTDGIRYDAFGNVTSESSPANGDRFKFGGGEFDGNLNLYHFGARWYDPAGGRWMSQDPLGLGPDSNPYRYVANEPTAQTDLTGLASGLTVPSWIVEQAAAAGAPTRPPWYLISYMLDHGIPILSSYLGSKPHPTDIWDDAWAVINDLPETVSDAFNALGDVKDFVAGFLAGVGDGAAGFVTGIGDFVGNLVAHPIDTVNNIIAGVEKLITLAAQGDVKGVLQQQFPLLVNLIDKWPTASAYDRGYMAGQIVGEYGAGVLTGALAQKLTEYVSNKIGGSKKRPSSAPGCGSEGICFVARTPVLIPRTEEEMFGASQPGPTTEGHDERPWWLVYAAGILFVSWTIAEPIRKRKRQGGPDEEETEPGARKDEEGESGRETADLDKKPDRQTTEASLAENRGMDRDPTDTPHTGELAKPATSIPVPRRVGPPSFMRSCVNWLARLTCLAALVLGIGLWDRGNPKGNSSALPEANERDRQLQPWKTKSIEALRVGDRVVTGAGEVAEPKPTKVDPSTWRLVRICAWERWADGTLDDIHIETLQPPTWLAAHRVRVGAHVPLPLDLVEMGLPEEMRGEVLAIEPCPRIRTGPGRVVLTTVNHLNAYVLGLTVEDRHGHREKIRPTGHHKFFRASDGKWVPAEQLRFGHQLQGQQGLLRVVANNRVPGVHRVYNLTVEGDHLYRVSFLGALVHNNTCSSGSTPEPDIKYHYTNAPESEFHKPVGLWSGSSVTDNPNLTPTQAVQQLGLKKLPDKIIPIQDGGNFRPNAPPIVKPHVLGPGGGTDFTNKQNVPPKYILPAIPITPDP
jgi:RHS repeat-associated protein